VIPDSYPTHRSHKSDRNPPSIPRAKVLVASTTREATSSSHANAALSRPDTGVLSPLRLLGACRVRYCRSRRRLANDGSFGRRRSSSSPIFSSEDNIPSILMRRRILHGRRSVWSRITIEQACELLRLRIHDGLRKSWLSHISHAKSL